MFGDNSTENPTGKGHKIQDLKEDVAESETESVMTRIGKVALLGLIFRLILNFVLKFWGLCTTALLILLLTYWKFGGFVTLGLLISGIFGLLYQLQDRLLYHPYQPSHSRLYVDSPNTLGMPHENIFIKSIDGVRINLLFIKRPGSEFQTAPTVIYFHGNAGNIGHRLLSAYVLHSFCGANVLLVEYRGYGKSSGSPNEKGIYLDAEAAVDYLLHRPDIDHSKLILFGRSLGGAVAIHIASQAKYASKLQCLLVENTFTSIPDISRVLFDFRILAYLPNWCFKSQYPSSTNIKKTTVPTLFISGLADNLIPPAMMLQLYRSSSSILKRLVQIDGGTHNETWQCQGYVETINRYLAEVTDYHNGKHPMSDATYTVEVPFDDGGVHQI